MGQADVDIREADNEEAKAKGKKKVSKKKDADSPVADPGQEEAAEEKKKKKKKDEEGGAEGDAEKKKKKKKEEEGGAEGDGEKKKKKKKDGEGGETADADAEEKKKKKKKEEEGGAEGDAEKKKKKKKEEEGGAEGDGEKKKKKKKDGEGGETADADAEDKKKKKKKTAEGGGENSEDAENKKKKKKVKSEPELTAQEIVDIMNTVTKDGDLLFTQQLTVDDRCVCCGLILRVPVLLEDCGHRCCSNCLPAILKAGSQCPSDKTSLKQEHIKVDKDYQVKMDLYDVRCSWLAQGCPWAGQLGTLGVHLGTCEYKLMDCPNECGEKLLRRDLDEHVSKLCHLRTTKCKFCHNAIATEKEMAHYDVCPQFPVACPNGCKLVDIPRSMLAEHMKNTCPKQDLPCPFAEHGCDFKGLKFTVDGHCGQAILEHLLLLNTSVHQMSVLLEAQGKAFSDLKSTMTEQTKRITGLERCSGASFVWKIDQYEEKLRLAKSGKQGTIFSPGFYTHRCGYRMVLSACLNGTGDGRGKYMSVYCALCRGDHDSLLQWPFAHELKFQLLDQNPELASRKHIEYVVKPNPTPEQNMFLGRPTSDHNAYFGAPRFISLEMLQNSTYILENCIFLKLTLNLDEVPPI